MAKTSSFLRDKSLFLGGAIVSFLIICALWSFLYSWSEDSEWTVTTANDCAAGPNSVDRNLDPPDPTFYDDPTLTYTFGSPVKDWDKKRKAWLKLHPSFAAGARDRVVVITGSQPRPCENPIGDHLLLKLLKNKVDYCRIHGYDLFYNNEILHRKMPSVWAKLPPVRAAMVAHPEAEWIWWIDSDAVITDMEFKFPFKKYKNHNLVINGWEDMVYVRKSWLGLNTGIFLLRNCQWSMDFIEKWASMSPLNPNHEQLTKTVLSTVKEKEFQYLDEQSSLVYLMLTGNKNLRERVYIENDYSLSGYWLSIVDRLENISEKYKELEREVVGLRRRRGEKVSEKYGEMKEEYLKGTVDGGGGWRRPFVTHFTGCQPCSGHYNPSYTAEKCWKGMEKALNFGDNQVLRHYGFVRVDLLNTSHVSVLEFDSPA